MASYVHEMLRGALSAAELESRFTTMQFEEAVTGTITDATGLTIVGERYPSVAAADAWLETKVEKYGPAIAVRAVVTADAYQDVPFACELGDVIWVLGALID